MDSKIIERGIIDELCTGKKFYHTFRKKLVEELNVPESSLVDVFDSLENREIIEVVKNPNFPQDMVRLTHPAKLAMRPWYRKFMEYLQTHWIAIVALIISILALFKDH